MSILNSSQIASLAFGVGLSSTQVQIATAIALAEHRGVVRTDAVNNNPPVEISVGVWQINTLAHKQYSASSMKDPVQNAKAMFVVSGGGVDWSPWSTYTDGLYKKYLSSSSLNNIPRLQPITNTSQNASFLALSSTVEGNPDVYTDKGSGYAYILAYIVAGAIFTLMAKTRLGYNALYYGASLLLILLLATQSQFFVKALAPISAPATPQTVNL